MLQELQRFHPLVIEGMDGYDPRKPEPVASIIIAQLRKRWLVVPPSKPIILVTRGLLRFRKW